MDKTKFKKIATREVLVLLGTLVIGGFIMFGADSGGELFSKIPQHIDSEKLDILYSRALDRLNDADRRKLVEFTQNELKQDKLVEFKTRFVETALKEERALETKREISDKIATLGSRIFLFGYPIYLIFRFAIWAIMKLIKR